MKTFGVIVVGGGHAGIEAALAPARMGVPTLMINLSFDTIGQMSCNPAIGGVGKGQLVKEVDILGGEMGLAADRTGIQFRRLNASKGQAVRSSRCQSDRIQYRLYMQDIIRRQPNLTFLTGEATEILVKGGRVVGITVSDGRSFEAPTVIVTAGTFLNGRIHLGPKITPGGRLDEPPAVRLADSLRDLGFALRSFKTGTPPRLDGRTIDYHGLSRQDSDDPPVPFSFRTRVIPPEQELRPCWLTSTNEQTHEIIRSNFHLSPMYSGQIDATGVRYCPSIEDKLKKFSDKASHPVFLEPDGLDTPIVYPNGISTGLPEDIQEAFVRTIKGLEKATFIRHGYSIEHGVIYAEELKPTLESKRIAGLFLAGQVNGTTGYEEAAAQGILAGINAALKVKGEEPFILRRDEAYLGVLVDDLITKGTNEPYRMFTSRVEYRLIIREDNTDQRLAHHAHRFGLMTDAEFAVIGKKYDRIRSGMARLEERKISALEINPVLSSAGTASVQKGTNLYEILKRPEITLSMLLSLEPAVAELTKDILDHIEYDIKYEGFIERQRKEVAKFRHLENIMLPTGLNYADVPGLSIEVRQKLGHFRPATLGQANRISGVTPAAISILMVYLRKFHATREGQ